MNSNNHNKEMDAHDHKMFPYQSEGEYNNTGAKQPVKTGVKDANGIEYRGEGIDMDQDF
jgi:hypothetical protein